jgi:hypothetical protein
MVLSMKDDVRFSTNFLFLFIFAGLQVSCIICR